jgi:hypothetical protein
MVSCSCLYAANEEFPSISWCTYGLSLLLCVLVAPICMYEYYCWSRCSIEQTTLAALTPLTSTPQIEQRDQQKYIQMGATNTHT